MFALLTIRSPYKIENGFRWRNGEIAKETFSLDVNHCNVLRTFLFADFFRLFLIFAST